MQECSIPILLVIQVYCADYDGLCNRRRLLLKSAQCLSSSGKLLSNLKNCDVSAQKGCSFVTCEPQCILSCFSKYEIWCYCLQNMKHKSTPVYAMHHAMNVHNAKNTKTQERTQWYALTTVTKLAAVVKLKMYYRTLRCQRNSTLSMCDSRCNNYSRRREFQGF